MNNSARDVPAPGAPPGPVAIECPQCRTQLRLLAQATVHTPISCCMCGATFYLQPIETAPLSDDVVAPRRAAAPGPRASFRVISPPSRGTRRVEGPRATALTAPVPPPPQSGARAAPGMPKPVELPDHLQRNFRTRWMESVLGAALVLLLVVAACAGGFVLIRTIWTKPAPVHREEEAAAAGDATSTQATPTSNYTPDIASVLGGSAQPLARPDQMAGTWESRADDGSHSIFVFFPNGKIVIAPAGEPRPKPLETDWFLAEKQGDDALIEVGPAAGSVGNYMFNLRFTAEDAFTLTKTIHHGIIHPGDLRYIRIGPPEQLPSVPLKVIPQTETPKPAEKPAVVPPEAAKPSGDPPP
jgi:hypothetical protein